MDYMEIMDLCSYDTKAARDMIRENYCTADVVEEVLAQIGLEAISKQSHGEKCRGLCREGCICRSGR